MAEEGMRPLAGGTDLYPATDRQTLAGQVVDLTAIPGLRGISTTDRGVRIGACTTWADLVAAKLPPSFEALREAALEVGSIQVQNAATIGGNLCNASPAADGVPPLLALDAFVELNRPGSSRRVALGDFVLGNRETALENGEVLTAIHVPSPACRGGSAFEKLGARRFLVISIAMVAARFSLKGGVVEDAALCIGSCSETAVRLRGWEAAILGSTPPEATKLIAALDPGNMLEPLDDIRADARYRFKAAKVLCQAVARKALARAEKLQ